MDGHAICVFGYWSVCSNGDVWDCFKFNRNGEFQMGVESIGYVIVVLLFINVIWEIRKW